MPKDRRVNSSSFDRAMVSPYSCSLKISDGGNGSFLLVGDEREWEEARCSICMEHPHNAVLLLCSSREKGCRPFICDTSYRHSNCLDQLRKSADVSSLQTPFDHQKCELVCPLCRGLVTGWDVIHTARKFMNSKSRNCSLETCSFNGNYAELRKHARLEHPSGRPSEASLNRQLNWEALERQREIEDALAHQSDVEYDFDEWFDDIWSDESFFDFSSGMSDIENESIDEMDMFSFAMSLFSLCPSSPDETIDSGSSRSSERPPRSVLPTNSNLRSDNHEGYMSNTSRSISRNHSEEGGVLRQRLSHHRETDSMNIRSVLGFDRENDLNLNSDYNREYVPRSRRTRSSYLMGNASTNLRTRSSYLRRNASTNLRSISSSRRENASNIVSSRSSYDQRANVTTSSYSRLSYPRENGPTASGLRSSYFRENAPSSSRVGSSYFRHQDAWPSSRSRARTTFHPREEAYSPVSRIHLRGSSRMPHSSHGRRQG